MQDFFWLLLLEHLILYTFVIAKLLSDIFVLYEINFSGFSGFLVVLFVLYTGW